MNIEFFSNRTRLLAAGLCGAAVLTFAGLETQTAQAQEDPEPMKPADANQEQDETVIKESENKQTIGRLDLSSVQFEGEILRKLGDTAVIVEFEEQELLLPNSLISLRGQNDDLNRDRNESTEPMNNDLGNDTADSDMNDDEMLADTEQSDNDLGNDTADSDMNDDEMLADTEQPDNDLGNDTADSDMNDDEMLADTQQPDNDLGTAEVRTETTVDSTQQDLNEGDTVTVSLDTTDAELIALENDVLTVRDGELIMQLPISELSDEMLTDISFNAKVDGESKVMTLKEAVDAKRDLTLSQGWSKNLPQDAKTGVIVANKPGKLMLVTVANNAMELVEIPQSFLAGEAVSLERSSQGNVRVEPLDNQVAFEQTEFSGKLLSRNDEFVVIENEDQQMLLPAELKMEASNQNEEIAEGSSVTVVMPAGNAEMLAEDDGQIVLRTPHGLAQLPSSALNL